MDNDVLYAIIIDDVKSVAAKRKVAFSEKDLRLIEEKICDFMGETWKEAVEYALEEVYGPLGEEEEEEEFDEPEKNG